jgi:hypothetical protein
MNLEIILLALIAGILAGNLTVGIWSWLQNRKIYRLFKELQPSQISSDGKYLYVTLDTTPAQVVKIDPTTMQSEATWTGKSSDKLAGGENYAKN